MNKFLFRIPKALRLFLGLSLGTTSAFAVAPTITSPLADTYTIGAPAGFTHTIVASGVPTSFAAVSLPPFLSHDGKGLISGTPTEDGLFKFTIAASNADGIDIQTFELTVEDVTPVITSASSASGAAGDPFEYDITADNLPDIFDITGLEVFDGLIFDPDAGTIRGTPTTAGKTGDVIIEATNSAGTGFAILTITIGAPLPGAPPVIISPLAATAVVGQVFNYQIETQLVAPVDPITYAATSLPSGLSHDGNGLISGTPVEDTAVSGPIEITIAASNGAGTDSQVLFLTIVDLVPSISSSSTATGNEGSSFSYTITADNEPDTFSVTGLEAFDGLSFNPLTGEISGIPTAQLVADVFIRATNSAGTDSEVLTITIGAPLPGTPPVITSALVEETLFGQPYIYTIEATNSPTSYSIGGDPLPQGLSYSGNAITGEPTESGTFYITLSASNAFGESTVETLELTVNPLAPVITSDNFVNGNVGSPFSYQILATGGPVLTYSASLANLPGLTLDPNTGRIFGTPTTEGTVTISVSATNVTGTGTDEIEITIRPALPPSPTPPSVATVNSVTYTTPTVASAGALNGAVLDYFDGDDIDPDGLSRTQEELNQLTVIADVTPAAGETIDTVFVRWNNPPAKPDGTPRAPIILAQLVNTAGNDYQATVDIGFDPENREIGGGSIDLEVVAYQTNALSTDDFASDSSTFRIDPLLEVLFPDDNLTPGFFDVGDIFASARVGTNDFSKVTARISGPGIVFSSEDDDASDNENGLHNFDLPQLINFEGTYQVEVTVEDLSGATTVVRKQLFLSEIIGAPTALIVSPTPGFTNEVFTPAVLQYTETSRAIVTVNQVGVVGVNVSYSLSLVSAGQGYFPRNASGATLLTTGGNNVTRGIAGVTLSNGRVDTLPDEVTIFYSTDSDGNGTFNDPDPEWGSFGNAVMDDLRDPGANGKIDISAQFFRALGELKTYRLFVNGADLTPGNGNLDIDDGPIDIPAIEFPPAGQGSPDPGDYVVFAQVFDENGQTATSSPITFQILPYEPLEISLSREVAPGVDPTDPILIGCSATFLAQVSPVNKIDEVEFFESNSGDSLGFGSRVQISGDTFFRFSNVFAEAGDFKVFARATGFNGQTVISAPVDISVLSGDFPTVEITSPADGDSVTAGNNLPILIQAGDANDGQITAVEVFDGSSSLGTATPTGLADEYRLNFTPTVSDIGVLNLIARATDDRGNQTSSEVVVVGVVRGEVPQIEILEPAEGDSLNVDQPFTVRARITDGDGIITSATLTDVNFALFVNDQGVTTVVDTSLSFDGDVMSLSSTPDEFVFIATIGNPDVVDLVVTATDDDGNTVQSEIVQFTVTSGFVPDVKLNTVNGVAVLEVGFASLVAGLEYEIVTQGNTDFTTLGAADNDVGTTFIYNGDTSQTDTTGTVSLIGNPKPINLINPLIPGLEYEIVTQGNTDFTTLGAVDGSDVGTLIEGEQYEIHTTGNTDFTELGAADNNVGTTFTYNGDTSQADTDGTVKVGVGTTFTYNGDTSQTNTTGTVSLIGALPPVDLGSLIPVEITASDLDGSVTQVEVFNGATSLGLANLVGANTYRFDYVANAVGLVNLQARATDDRGNVGISNVETISVVTGGIPAVTIDSPFTDQEFTISDVVPVLISAIDTDVDGQIIRVEVFDGLTSLGFATKTGNGAYRFDYVASELGLVDLRAIAVDDRGNPGLSNIATISVVTGAVPTGLILLPDGPYYEGDMLTVDVNVDDLDGYVTSVEIFNGDVSLGVASKVNDTKFRLVHGPLTPGNLQLRAVVTDDRGNISASNAVSTLVGTNTLPILRIVSPTAKSSHNYGDVIPFEITAFDDGSISSVSVSYLDNGTPSELGQALFIGNDQYRFFLDSATLPTAGTKYISVVAVDDRGNTSTELVEIQLNVVPFSVEFTSPTASPYVIEGAPDEFFSATRSFTVEVGGIDASTLASIEWQLDDGSPAVSQTLDGGLTYSQNFEFSNTGTLTVTATNSGGVSVQSSLTVFVDLPNPSSYTDEGLEDFIYFIYKQVQGLVPSEEELEDAIQVIGPLGDDTPDNRAAYAARAAEFAAELFPSDQYSNSQSQTVALVYKTLTGLWPTQTQLEAGLEIISQDTATSEARALVEALKGEYNGSNGFLADVDTDSFNLAPSFVAQIYRNKHGVGITTLNSGILGQRLTGIDKDMGNGYILPGYQSDVVNFVADFALDVNLATGPITSIPTGDGYPYTKIVYYGRPNNPLSSWDFARKAVQFEANRSFALRALLPAAQGFDVSKEETLKDVLAKIFGSVEFANQFPGDTTLIDTDDDGVSNIAEILLNTDPSDGGEEPTSTGSTTIEGNEFVLEFVRLKPEKTPAGISIVVQSSSDLSATSWTAVPDLESELEPSADQSGITSDYERVELRFNMTEVDRQFFRLSVQQEAEIPK